MAYRIPISLSILVVLVTGCMNSGKERATDNIHQDSVSVTPDTNKLAPAVLLKQTEVNSKTMHGNSKFFKSRVLDENEINRLSLRLIDSTGSGNEGTFRYHVIDTLFSNSRGRVILIWREYTEENIVWLATYDSNSRFVDRLMVYYDNSEGSTQVGSVIKRNEVEVTTLNDYSESPEKAKKPEQFRVDENNKIVKIR